MEEQVSNAATSHTSEGFTATLAKFKNSKMDQDLDTLIKQRISSTPRRGGRDGAGASGRGRERRGRGAVAGGAGRNQRTDARYAVMQVMGLGWLVFDSRV
jgi:hypothetical protein